MIREKLLNQIKHRKCTLVGIGPMSKNCVDATIRLANELDIHIVLIASRRQIECAAQGGGYVNNWTTEDFATYVKGQDKNEKILLARDHGGPWQSPSEVSKGMNLREAMDSAKQSYECDIRSGFHLIHIDGGIDIHKAPTRDEALERIFELYSHCWKYAQKLNRLVEFEIGTEEQTGTDNTIEDLEYTLEKTHEYCKKNSLPMPLFVVVQTGTLVKETENVGKFETYFKNPDSISKLIELCNRFEICLKEHNTDYLSDEALAWHPKLGIHAANIAPEFGVAETRAFLKILEANGLNQIYDRFIKLAENSGKWQKWLKPNSSARTKEKAIIAGHYVFSSPEFLALKKEAQEYLDSKKINIDQYLQNKVSNSIMRYLNNFNLATQKDSTVNPQVTHKPWGVEELLVSGLKYEVRRLTMKKGHRYSLQYHQVKAESVYLISGLLRVMLGPDKSKLTEHILSPNEMININPMQIHRLEAIEESVYLKASTTELDDVVRVEDDDTWAA